MTNALYAFLCTLWYMVALLPLRALYVLSDCLYPIVYYIVRYRRKIVRNNLTTSFPEKTEAEIKQIEHQFYHFFCDYAMETFKLMHISRDEMRRRITFTGIDEINAALDAQGKLFCFVYLGHFCNWEWVASLPYWAPADLHCAQIYHPLYSKAHDRLFLKIRSQFGGENIPMSKTLRRVIELKQARQKTIIGFISDQLPKWNSIHHFTPFLNHETAVFIGTEQMSKQLDALVYYAVVKRPRRGYYTCEFRPMTDNAKAVPDYDLTDHFMRLLEGMIRETPGLWLWSHNRWKRTKEEWERRKMEGKQR